MGLIEEIFKASMNGQGFLPVVTKSTRFKNCVTVLDLHTCFNCSEKHGFIFFIYEKLEQNPPLHPNCRCSVQPLEAIEAGTATVDGTSGADWHIKNVNKLPDNYITKEELKSFHWKRGKAPSNYAPGKIVGGNIYKNDDLHLPHEMKRIWYEADINYVQGKRNSQRLVYSDDGLIFVTYNHYQTFYEIN